MRNRPTPTYLTLICAALTLLSSCASRTPENVTHTHSEAPIYPDYKDITIPVNIAPLNFLLRENTEDICVYVDDDMIYQGSGNEVTFDEGEWRDMLNASIGKKLGVRIVVKSEGKWKEYDAFTWEVSADRVNPYLTYRLIEPDYEVFNELVLQERCVESFDTRNFCDHNVIGNKCMNCHVYSNQSPDTSMFYVRGKDGGAILNTGGQLRKLDIKKEGMVSSSVYYSFSPNGRFLVFSANEIIPAFHSSASKRMEVFDSKSDVYIADLRDNSIKTCPMLCADTINETFPTFSPDGKYVYYCAAPSIDSLPDLRRQRYSLCRVAFDEHDGTLGESVDTIYNSRTRGKSVCHPRFSPDGAFIVYTVADYGTFPIWHRESDLQMMDMRTGETKDMDIVNSDMSDTYHSWSSNSRWLVFASKRDDGLYGKAYYTHVDKDGECSKPFVLPQKYPTYYDNTLKSFNAPEQGKGKLPFSVNDVKRVLSSAPTRFR